MIYMLFPVIILILVILILRRKILVQKLKLFFKKYKWLMLLEIFIIICIMMFNMFDKIVIVKEEDPHTGKELKSTTLKEGEQYEYYVMQFIKEQDIDSDKIGSKYILSNIQKRTNQLYIKKVGVNEVTIEKDQEEIKYNYGKGFSYYGPTSCNCGTPIRFYKRFDKIFRILILSIIVIDLLIICLIKETKPKGEK